MVKRYHNLVSPDTSHKQIGWISGHLGKVRACAAKNRLRPSIDDLSFSHDSMVFLITLSDQTPSRAGHAAATYRLATWGVPRRIPRSGSSCTALRELLQIQGL